MGGKSEAQSRLDNRLKDIEEKLELPPLAPELRSFVDWVANYTVSSRGMVLRMCLRMGEHLGAERERVGVRLAGAAPARMTAARQRVLALLADGMVRGKSEAAREAGVSAGVVDGLVDEGTLETVVLPPEPVAEKPDPDFTPSRILGRSGRRCRSVAGESRHRRLFGDAARRRDRFGQDRGLFRGGGGHHPRRPAKPDPDAGDRAHRAIPRPLRRALRRAAGGMAFQLSPRKRARTWRAVAGGEVSVVVGARSALFLPYADLGLIVVDEEHDPAYKQEDGVHYHARDMAVVRGHIARIPVVLSSATPSVETEVNARRGRYRAMALPERFGGQLLPAVEAIDLRASAAAARPLHLAGSWPARCKTSLERQEQALLFLNRRGYAPLTLCRDCGFRFSCPNCDAWLVDHRFRKQLVCHHCGFAMPHPRGLPEMPASKFLCRLRSGRRAARRRGARRCFPRRAFWCCRAIWSPRSNACARNSPKSPKAGSTSSSARSWSPRATTSRCSIWSAWSTPISA